MARCGISGVVYNFEVYTGKNNTKKDNEIEGIVVYCLTIKTINIFSDNFFSGTALKLLK